MKLRKNQILDVEVIDMTAAGDGVAKPDGFAVFIIGAIPGDLLRIAMTKVKKHYGYARILEILTPSPDRIPPYPGEHERCGGCRIQHMAYEAQLRWKRTQVQNNLERIGKIDHITVPPVHGMDNPTHYRNKAQYPLVQLKDGRIAYGFYAPYSHRVIPNPACLIQSERTDALMAVTCRFFNDEQLDVYDERTGKGLLRHVVIREGRTGGELMLILVINGNDLPHKEILLERVKDIPGLVSVFLNIQKDDTNVVLGDTFVLIAGKNYIEDVIGDKRFRIGPQSFYQVNPSQTKVLYDTIRSFAEPKADEIICDLYCGIGTIGLYLADSVKELIGIEVVAEAVAFAKKNAALNGCHNARFYCDDAANGFARLQAEGLKPDTIIVDPPRKGCSPALLKDIAVVAPRKVVYVSCDSATLARDLQLLGQEGYTIKQIQCVDMFPMTPHVECVALLSTASDRCQ
ncbi:MAG: 23S rRNA (uracil(1939)-C(5))-methyltransferase RlmD [Eubacteriales bacterium]|nr:23S rRNA (uracil(1939)-C(5))-methyltransferase RlmD [Eubacteriales bacterium]